jgi:hypothetical protein
MRATFAVILVSAMALAMPTRAAGPLVELPASRAGMCDAYDGLAFTFCVALCEARECDRRASDDARCALLARGFARMTRGGVAPCASGVSTVPL